MRKVQDRIVMIHDYFRSKVRPKAANMLSMVRQEFTLLNSKNVNSNLI